LDELGYELMKRPPPPPPAEGEEAPVEEELTEEELAKKAKEQKKKDAEEAKKAKEEEELRKAKEERARVREAAKAAGEPFEESEPEEEKIEDLSVDDLVLKVEEDGSKESIGGFILLGFPHSDVHATKLKEHGIEFDKILQLSDPSEEEAGKEVIERMSKVDMHYNWEQEVEKVGKVLAAVKEVLGEDITSDVNATGSIEDVTRKMRFELDPFYLRVDNADENRTNADVGEDEKKLAKGDFGDYCPVTYVKDNFLQRGNNGDEGAEVTVYGKTYTFAGEKEMEEFKLNPHKFLIGMNGEA
jgi:hypothetical protein